MPALTQTVLQCLVLVLVVPIVSTDPYKASIPLMGFSWSSKGFASLQSSQAGDREGSYGQFNPNSTLQLWFNSTDARNSAELEFGLTGGFPWQPHSLQDQPAPPEGFGIDPRLGEAALRAQAASKEDSRPHAILKLQPRNSFDYRVRYEPQTS